MNLSVSYMVLTLFFLLTAWLSCLCDYSRSNKYTDFVGTWGPAIVGHADDEVLDAIKVISVSCVRVSS